MMTPARHPSQRKNPARKIDLATSAVIESLEDRLFLSATLIRDPRSHMVTGVLNTVAQTAAPQNLVFTTPPKSLGSPFLEFPAGTIRQGAGGYTADKIRHLYGIDNLDAYNPAYPLFTNVGNNQVIVVIGGAALQVNDTLIRQGNINLFSASNGVPGLTNPVQIDNTLIGGGLLNPVTDTFSAVESTMQMEWAHAFAPAASIIFVEVPTTSSNPASPNFVPGIGGGVIMPANLQAGLQQAIADLQAIQPGPIDQFGPGGVVTMSLASVGEDPTLAAQYDAIFNQAAAANISFIAPTGDYGSTLSMPATSPAVTAVGGTLYKIDATGKRIYETASLPSGGGSSTVEALPVYQQGLRAGKTALTTRSVPDLSAISQTQGLGVDVYYDPTPNGTGTKHWTEEGTSVSAPIIAGMVADANELRSDVGLSTIGNQLNATLYQGFRQLPSLLFTDITQGNNILHHAVKGYDQATGMGVPKADSLIPYLAGIVNVTANIKFSGSFTTTLTAPPVTLTTFRAAGTAQVGSQYVSFSLPLNVVQTTGKTPISAVFTPSLISRNPDNSFDGTGTVAVTSTTTVGTVKTTGTVTYNVEIVGTVRGRATSPQISGQIYTIDPNTGRRLFPGTSSVFQGSFRT